MSAYSVTLDVEEMTPLPRSLRCFDVCYSTGSADLPTDELSVVVDTASRLWLGRIPASLTAPASAVK